MRMLLSPDGIEARKTEEELAMIIGAHSILYSKNPDVDRGFLRDVLGFPNVDVGGGWLIFGLPPSEVAVHPGRKNDVHEFYLMCDDVDEFVSEMKRKRIACGPVENAGWGLLTHVKLPGGGKLGVYQPRHARPKPMTNRRPNKAATRKKPVPGTGRGPRTAGSAVSKAKRTGRASGIGTPKKLKTRG